MAKNGGETIIGTEIMSQAKNISHDIKYGVDGHGDVYITYTENKETEGIILDQSILEQTFRFLDVDLLEDMCEEYPSLDTVYQKFKTTYNLCVDEFNRTHNKKLIHL